MTDIKTYRSDSYRFESQPNRLTGSPQQQLHEKLIPGIERLIVELGAKEIDYSPNGMSFRIADCKFKLTLKKI